MNTICDIDSLIHEVSNYECKAPERCEFDSDSEDGCELEYGSREHQTSLTEDHVDANLFVGLLKIILDETDSYRDDSARKANYEKRKADNEELMNRAMADGEEETPEVSWFYRNQYIVQKSETESENKNVISGVQRHNGHCQLLRSMLRECLLKRRYRQAAYAVWGLASLTRIWGVNRDLFVLMHKASLEIFVAKTASEGLNDSERSHYQLSSLEKFVRTLLDCSNVDPREVGIDWLLLLLRHGRYSEATQLQQQIEKERRKQFHHKSSDPRMAETKRLFMALSGLSCFVYAKMLRKGIADEADDDEQKTLHKSVKFLEQEEVEDDDEGTYETCEDAKHLGDMAIGAAKRELKADQMDEIAANAFEGVIFNSDTCWDAFVPPYVAILKRKPDGVTLVLDVLEKYKNAHPNNPNAQRFLFEYIAGDHLNERIEASQRQIWELEEHRKILLKDSLTAFNALAPMDKIVALKLVNFLEIEQECEELAETSRRQMVGVLFHLLDYPEWKRDLQCWKRLVKALTDVGSAGSVESESDGRSVSSEGSKGSVKLENLLRARGLMKREWFETRADWWPKLHFSARAAAEDLRCPDGKSLIKRKNQFAKFVKRMARNELFAREFDSSITEKCFKAYGERIKMLISQAAGR